MATSIDEKQIDYDDYYDLGKFTLPVTTNSKSAQKWFDRGLIWSYGFHHEESVKCFRKAIEADSNCAMAYWGLAYSLGPNYNMQWEVFDEATRLSMVENTHRVVQQAADEDLNASPVEKSLIQALQHRYPKDKPPSDFSIWSEEYANAMGIVYDKFPNDLNVTALYADALMNMTPWELWDIRTGEPAKNARTLEAKAVLERGLAQKGGYFHPGLLHFYIHLMEMSSTPEAAFPAVNNLRRLVPDSGHLNHMPTHLDIICGDYSMAMLSNMDAIQADLKYFKREGYSKFYTLYCCHNAHFRLYAAMFAGHYKIAIETVEIIEKILSEEVLRIKSPPMADFLESFLTMRVHVLVRFGKWKDLVALLLPDNQELYCTTTATIFYGKSLAFAAIGKIEEAVEYSQRFEDAFHRVKPSRRLFNNKCRDILEIARTMLVGEIEYRKGNFDIAFGHLRRSIELYDTLPFEEPWGWMQPTRHAYGALLLEQGYIQEAESVFKADLGIDNTLPKALRHPNNVWALHGYHECLRRGGKIEEADIIQTQLKTAIGKADIQIRSACFCRLTHSKI